MSNSASTFRKESLLKMKACTERECEGEREIMCVRARKKERKRENVCALTPLICKIH